MKPYNKNIMTGILLAEKALLKSPYVKRYVHVHSDTANLKEIYEYWNDIS